MPGVTSLSVLFLLLALCPLDVAGLPKDIRAIYLQENTRTISLMDLRSQSVSDLFSTPQPVNAMDYDPVNQKVYWCTQRRQCFVQDYNGSNPTILFDTKDVVKDIKVDKTSASYYLDVRKSIWVKRNGQPPELVTSGVLALAVDKLNGRIILSDESSRIRDSAGKFSIQMNESVHWMSWNPSDSLLYFAVYRSNGSEIRSIDLNTQEQRTILKDFIIPRYISTYADVVVFGNQTTSRSCSLYVVDTNGKNYAPLGAVSPNCFTKPVLFDGNSLPGSATTKQGSVQGCLQTIGGTSIKVTLTPGMEDFSLLVMDPPNGCSRDLGQFRQNITVPESCVVDQEVEVAIQLTEIKDILGGRFFRHFLFSCSDLGPDGTVMKLMADTNPSKTQATASNTSYADGSFSLMVVTSANLNSGAELTNATNVIWSQDGVFLVLRHRLATGSQHRTLIPAECTINSTSHPEKKTIWISKPDMECKQEMGLIDAWTIQSQRTAMDDVAYTQLFPFDFQVGEEVTITCAARECPYVADARQLQGKCLEAFKKYKSCGGTFRGSSPKRRREITSLSGNGSVPVDQTASRVMSASFTLV